VPEGRPSGTDVAGAVLQLVDGRHSSSGVCREQVAHAERQDGALADDALRQRLEQRVQRPVMFGRHRVDHPGEVRVAVPIQSHLIHTRIYDTHTARRLRLID